MTFEQHQQIVEKLEKLARQSPASYRTRVMGLAALGYLYYITLTLIILLLLGGFIFVVGAMIVTGKFNVGLIKILLIVGVFLISMSWMLLKALFVRLEPPTGIELRRDQVPQLFSLLDELQARLQLPPLKRVLLTDDYNASVVQIPRFFIIGPQHNYLILGYALMASLTVPQFKSVLAHEFGHLSGNHGRFGNWIYRVRATWGNLLSAMGNAGQSNFLVRRFINWYVPYFDAYTYVLARDNEYDADRCAADMTTTRDAAQALVNIHTVGHHLDEGFWPALWNQSVQRPEPPREILGEMRNHWTQALSPSEAQRCLSAQFDHRTSPYETHPSLAARIKALGFDAPSAEEAPPLLNLPDPNSAAAALLLGSAEKSLREQLDEQWHSTVADSWKTAREERMRQAEKLKQLQDNAALDADARAEKAVLLLNDNRRDEAEVELRSIVNDHPNHAWSRYLLGTFLLTQKKEEGLGWLKGLQPDATPEMIMRAAGEMCDYLVAEGRGAEADAAQKELEPIYNASVARVNQRMHLDKKTTLIPHTLSDEELQAFVSSFSNNKLVRRVWLVRKDLPDGEKPLFVILLERKSSFLELSESSSIERFVKSLEGISFPHEAIWQILGSEQKWLRKKMDAIPGAKIYERGGK